MSVSADNSEHVDDVISIDENSEVVVNSPRGRKRIPQPHKWQENIRKKQRNSGQAYYSQMAKKHVESRKIGPCLPR